MNKVPLASIHKLKSALPLITALLCLTMLTAFSQKPELVVQTGDPGPARSLAYSPDGKMLASGGYGTAVLWDILTGKQLRTLTGPDGKLSFSPDGRFLLSGGTGNEFGLWEVNTGRLHLSLKGHTDRVTMTAFSPDGRFIASGDRTGLIKIWNPIDGRQLFDFRPESNDEYISSLVFSRDGQILVIGSGKIVTLLDMDSRRVSRRLIEHQGSRNERSIVSVAISRDKRTIASSSYNPGEVNLWDATTGEKLRTLKLQSGVDSIALTDDGKTLVTGSFGPTVKLWDVNLGTERRTLNMPKDRISELSRPVVALNPDESNLAAGYLDSDGPIIDVWNTSSGEKLYNLKGRARGASQVIFNPSTSELISGAGGHIKVWNPESDDAFRTLVAPVGYLGPMAISADGNVLATFGSGAVKFRNSSSGAELRTVDLMAGQRSPPTARDLVSKVALSRDFKVLVAQRGGSTALGADSGVVEFWNVDTGGRYRRFEGRSVSAMSPDGKHFIGATYDNIGSLSRAMRIWDVSTGQQLGTIEGSSRLAIYSPDGLSIAGVSLDGASIKVWDAATGRESVAVRGDFQSPMKIAYSSDGRTIAVGSFYGSITVWDSLNGTKKASFSGHTASVSSLAFNPGGDILASGSHDGTTRLWDLKKGGEMATLIAVDNDDWIVRTPDGRFDGSPDGMKVMHYVQENTPLPLDSFFEQFFTPKLLQKVYARETLPPTIAKVDFSKRIKLPPVVRITSPKPGSESSSDTAQITVEANDQGGGVEDIRLFHNGKRLDEATRQLTQDGKANTRTFEVSLLPGINTFRATAFNNDRTEAIPDEIKIELKRVEASANLYILAVGLNEYKNPRYNLNYGNADAKAFADAVEAKGKNIFKEIKKKVLFDAEASQLRIRAEMESIAKQARPQDVFVFFFAGHGKMSEPEVGSPADFFLVPYDVVNITGDGGSLVAKGIAAAELREMSRKISALKQLIVIDACESEGAVATLAMMRGPEEEKAIQQLARSAGVAVLASAGQNQVATEFKTLGHGVFTYALLKGLNGEADGAPKDGKVTVNELRAYLDDQVPELTKIHRGKPQYPNSFSRGQDFPIGVR